MYIVAAPRWMTTPAMAARGSLKATKLPTQGAPGLFRGMAGWIMEFLDRRAARQQLYEMSDYQLADMGVSRGQIGHVLESNFQDFEQVVASERAAGGA